jgi:CRP-like cAMP-binding protein
VSVLAPDRRANGTGASRRRPLLEVDPDLGARFQDPARRSGALRDVTVPVGTLPAGPCDTPHLRADATLPVGLLVLSGLLAREVVVADNASCELLGQGDLVRECDAPAALLRAQVRWTVLEPATVALLDGRAGLALGRYPEMGAAILDRLAQRSQRLAVAQAISQLNGVERRLVALFWFAAERWGQVVPGGVAVTLPLPQRLLAQVIGARRPTVSTALGHLAETGELRRLDDGRWLLPGDPVGEPEGEWARVIRARRPRFQRP